MALLTDPITTAGLVVREVRTGDRAGAPTRIAVARRSYRTDQADLWDALTNAERLPRWFLPISGELKVGGHYQLEGHAGGVIEECEAPRYFSVTFGMGEEGSWLTINLTPTDDGTQLELLHESHIDPERWAQFGPGAVGVGWDLALWGLGLYIATGEQVDKEAALNIHRTPEGRAFIEAAARGWGAAAIADGDDAATANAAADQTFAFYTTDPEDDPES